MLEHDCVFESATYSVMVSDHSLLNKCTHLTEHIGKEWMENYTQQSQKNSLQFFILSFLPLSFPLSVSANLSNFMTRITQKSVKHWKREIFFFKRRKIAEY